MESLYLLIPLSVGLVLAIIGIFGWAVNAGQFDDLDREATRILDGDAALDAHQSRVAPSPTEFAGNSNLEE